MTVRCHLCGRKVQVDFVKKWKHVFRYHPEVSLERLLPLLLNSDMARQLGASFARRLQMRIF